MVIKMKKYKIYDILTIAGLLVTIYGFALATLILPDKDFSEDENRYLQQKPKFSISALTSGKFTSEIATYFSDQIPLRNVFVGTKAVVEIAMQKQENDDVLLGSDGYLIPKNDHPDYDRAGKNIKAINRFSETLITSSDSSLSVDMRVAIAGRALHRPDIHRYLRRTRGAVDRSSDTPDRARGRRGICLLPHRPPLDDTRRVLRVLRNNEIL